MPAVYRVALLLDAASGFMRQALRGISAYRHAGASWRVAALGSHALDVLEDSGTEWDGLLGYIATRDRAERVRRQPVPAVNLGNRIPTPGIPQVIGDDVAMGRVAAEHLLDRGFRRFAYCSVTGEAFTRERGRGFSETVAAAGHPCDLYEPGIERSALWNWALRQADLARWVEGLASPVGALCAHDGLGVELLEACGRAGVRVPEDVAVVGVDNDAVLCEVAEPPLSSIDANTVRRGYEAAALLDRLMAGEAPPEGPTRIEPIGVVARRSSDTLAVDDENVRAAMRFIYEHADTDISVADAAAVTYVSRRTLEYRFRKLMGHTLGEAVRRAHVERARGLLLTSDLTLHDVARASGFKNDVALSHVFKRETGLSPGQYRKRRRRPPTQDADGTVVQDPDAAGESSAGPRAD